MHFLKKEVIGRWQFHTATKDRSSKNCHLTKVIFEIYCFKFQLLEWNTAIINNGSKTNSGDTILLLLSPERQMKSSQMWMDLSYEGSFSENGGGGNKWTAFAEKGKLASSPNTSFDKGQLAWNGQPETIRAVWNGLLCGCISNIISISIIIGTGVTMHASSPHVYETVEDEKLLFSPKYTFDQCKAYGKLIS